MYHVSLEFCFIEVPTQTSIPEKIVKTSMANMKYLEVLQTQYGVVSEGVGVK